MILSNDERNTKGSGLLSVNHGVDVSNNTYLISEIYYVIERSRSHCEVSAFCGIKCGRNITIYDIIQNE